MWLARHKAQGCKWQNPLACTVWVQADVNVDCCLNRCERQKIMEKKVKAADTMLRSKWNKIFECEHFEIIFSMFNFRNSFDCFLITNTSETNSMLKLNLSCVGLVPISIEMLEKHITSFHDRFRGVICVIQITLIYAIWWFTSI